MGDPNRWRRLTASVNRTKLDAFAPSPVRQAELANSLSRHPLKN
jgi:hypothetical protein